MPSGQKWLQWSSLDSSFIQSLACISLLSFNSSVILTQKFYLFFNIFSYFQFGHLTFNIPEHYLLDTYLLRIYQLIYITYPKILKNILFIHERHRESEAETQPEGEAGSLWGTPCRTRSQDPWIMTWVKGRCSNTGPHRCLYHLLNIKEFGHLELTVL